MENNSSKALNILGLASRARKILIGYDTVLNSMHCGKIKMVIIASDASIKTIETFQKKCYFYNIPIDLTFTSLEISNAIGKQNAKIVALCDQGFKESLEKLVKDGK